MSLIKKYTIDFIVIVTLIVLYFFYTTHGQKSFYRIISYVASNKSGLDIDIQYLNLHQYPYVKADILIEDKYAIHIHGFLSDIWSKRAYDMQYTLQSDRIVNKFRYIDGKTYIEGRIKGKRKYMHLTGRGQLLDGNVSYDLTKEKKTFKNVNLVLHDINSTKLLKILGQKAIFKGQANANLHFDYIDKKNKKGRLSYKVQDKDFHGHVSDLDISVAIEDEKHIFTIDVTTPDLSLKLRDGTYDQEKKYAHALYALEVKDLTAFKKELGGKYVGAFHADGEIIHDKHLKIKGFSNSLGGKLDFSYDKPMLDLTLIDIPFSSLMQRMSQTPILEASTMGKITYNVKKREMNAKIDLKHTKVLPSKLSESIYKEFDYDIVKESFTKSTIEASLKDGNFSSEIILANDKNHLILKDSNVETEKKSLKTYVHLKTPKHSLQGHLYARLDDYITQDIYLNFDGIVEKHYALKLDGIVNKDFINMDYVLRSKRLPSHIVTIEDNVSIKGHVNGAFSSLRIRGKGTALDGKIRFDGIKKGSQLEDVTVALQDIHSLKLSTLLGQPMLPSGKADVDLYFSYFNAQNKKGKIHYALKNGLYSSLPVDIDADIRIENDKHTFVADIGLAGTKINIKKGIHDTSNNLSSAFYTIDSKELSKLETLLGHKYLGSLYTMGNISYNNGNLEVRGLTKSYGGMIDYLYKKDILDIDLQGISLSRFMNLFPYPSMLDATVNGHINYDYSKELLLVKADLKNAKLLASELTDTIYQKSGIDLLQETFDNSTLDASYQNKILLGNIRLANQTGYFSLSNTKIDSKNNTIDAIFDFKMQEQEFAGKIFGSLDNPQINLDMQKLLRYQMDKQLDTYMGKGNRKMMESMPMGSTAKDVAADVGGGLLDMFF